jgi:hypothetical protein
MDVAVIKDIAVHMEGVGGATALVVNRFQPSGPSLSIASPASFGTIASQANVPGNMEFGVRVHF